MLKTGDMVVCGGRGPFAMTTRIVTAGFKNAFNKKVPVHTGVVLMLEGHALIVEMTGKGLVLSSFEKYRRSKFRWVMHIKRPPLSKNYRIKARHQIVEDLAETIEYDFKGLLEFVFKKVKDSKKKNYCSEYYYELTKEGMTYPEKVGREVLREMCSPYALDQIKEFSVVGC